MPEVIFTTNGEMLRLGKDSARALVGLAILTSCVTDGRYSDGKDRFRLVIGHEYFQLNACPKLNTLSAFTGHSLEPGAGDLAHAFGLKPPILTTAGGLTGIPAAGGLITWSLRESLCKDFTGAPIETIIIPISSEPQ